MPDADVGAVYKCMTCGAWASAGSVVSDLRGRTAKRDEQIRVLREALGPFANTSKLLEIARHEDPLSVSDKYGRVVAQLTEGDLHAAKAALDATAPKTGRDQVLIS